mgnify:CR=1 FL=1
MSIWISFICAIAVATFLLFFPGYLLLFPFRGIRLPKLAIAPIISIFIACVTGIITSRLLHSVDAWAFIGLELAIPILVLAASFVWRHAGSVQMSAGSCSGYLNTKDVDFHQVLYLVVGFIAAIYVFVSVLGSPEYFSVSIDNSYHLNEIHAIATTGCYSPVGISVYPTVPGYGSTAAGFYPAAWHVICAVVCNVLSVSTAVAINAVNFSFVAFVFPMSCFASLSAVTENKTCLALGALICISAYAFPWRLLTFGVLYSNLAAFCLVCSVCSVFLSLTKDEGLSIQNRLLLAFIFLFGLFDLFLLQPNGIFSVGVLLLPYAVASLYSFCIAKNLAPLKSLAAAFGLVVCFVVAWIVAYNLPMMQGVVSNIWSHYTSASQMLVNYLCQSYSPDAPSNFVLGFFVIVGLFYTFQRVELRWMFVSYFLSLVIHFSTGATEAFFKSWFAGFWYTDPYRTAALCTLAAFPLAVFGASIVYDGLRKRLFGGNHVSVGSLNRYYPAVFVALFVAVVFYPSFQIPGMFNVEMVFGKTRNVIKQNYDMSNPEELNSKELEFASSVKEIVGDSVVLNSPFDGSAFLYGSSDIQVYYRSIHSSPENNPNEQSASRAIRHGLYKIGTNSEMQDAVKATGARYLLLLDYDNCKSRGHVFTYNPDDWDGIESINDKTPGFTLVKKSGHSRLYRIDIE